MEHGQHQPLFLRERIEIKGVQLGQHLQEEGNPPA